MTMLNLGSPKLLGPLTCIKLVVGVGIPMVRDVVEHVDLEAEDPLGMSDKPEAVMATVTVEAADAPMMTPAFPMKCGSSYLRVSKMY